MPGAPLAPEHAPQRAVGAPALGGAGRVIRGAADDRVHEPDVPGADADQPAFLGLREPPDVRARVVTRSGDRPQIVPDMGRGHEQRTPVERIELLDPVGERAVQPAARRERQLDPGDAGPLVGGERGRQLDERQRVARRRLHDRHGDRRREVGRDPPEHLERRVGVEGLEPQLGERLLLEGIPWVAGRDDDRDGAAGPARRIQHALARRGVEPVHVVDHGEHGPLARGRAQEPQRRDADREPVPGRRRPERERGGECARLRRRQRREIVDDRSQEIRQRGERQLGLGLHPARPQHGDAVAAALGQRVEQRRLADPRIPAHDERTSVPAAQAVKQLVEPAEFRGAAHDHRPNLANFFPRRGRPGLG